MNKNIGVDNFKTCFIPTKIKTDELYFSLSSLSKIKATIESEGLDDSWELREYKLVPVNKKGDK